MLRKQPVRSTAQLYSNQTWEAGSIRSFHPSRYSSKDCRLVMTNAAHQVQPGTSFVIGREELLERSVQSCLESVGIGLLCEWDVLVFVYRHNASLASTDQIARLIGYGNTVVGDALERLEGEKLIERSRSSQGAHLCRIPAWADAERWRCLQQLLSLSETRAGRRLLARLLRPVRTRAWKEEPSTESRK
jgi:hypothetical protein